MLKRALLSLVISFFAALPAAAEGYPAGPVKFVVPFPPGGPLDVPARLVAQKLSQHWGKPVIVENQAGGSGFPTLVLQNWFGVFVPARTPDHAVHAIAAGWQHVLAEAEVRDKLVAMDLQPAWEAADTVRKAIADDLRRWADLARRAGIASPN